MWVQWAWPVTSYQLLFGMIWKQITLKFMHDVIRKLLKITAELVFNPKAFSCTYLWGKKAYIIGGIFFLKRYLAWMWFCVSKIPRCKFANNSSNQKSERNVKHKTNSAVVNVKWKFSEHTETMWNIKQTLHTSWGLI